MEPNSDSLFVLYDLNIAHHTSQTRLLKQYKTNSVFTLKVINEFLTNGGDSRSRTEQELRALFEKKLHKNPKVKVHKEKAKYCK